MRRTHRKRSPAPSFCRARLGHRHRPRAIRALQSCRRRCDGWGTGRRFHEPRNRVRHRRSARPDAAATAGFLLIGLLKTPLRWSGGVAAVAATIWAASAPATLGQRRTGARGHRHRTGSQPTSPPHSSIRCPSPFAARIPHQARAAWRECREFPSSLFILLSITVYQTLHFFRHFSRSTPGFITPRCV